MFEDDVVFQHGQNCCLVTEPFVGIDKLIIEQLAGVK
jgi:hypothetical protein